MCVQVQVCVCAGVGQRLLLVVVLRQHLSWNLELTDSARLSNQGAPETHLSILPSTGITDIATMQRLFVWMLGIELGSSRICDKHLTYHQSHLLIPVFFVKKRSFVYSKSGSAEIQILVVASIS